MAELTSSTRETARRLGVSDTTMHKAERSGRIARKHAASRVMELAMPLVSAKVSPVLECDGPRLYLTFWSNAVGPLRHG